MSRALSAVGLNSTHCRGVVLWVGMCAAQVVQAQDTSTTVSLVAKTSAVQSALIMPVEDRLRYLRKLKTFLEADPLDMAEFERQFEVKFECRPWRSTGKICDYRTTEARWPYAVFGDQSSVVSYSLYGNGTSDLLWVSLLYPGHSGAYNCITGGMLQQVFTQPEWTAVVDIAKTRKPQPDSALVLTLEGRDQKGRRVSILTMGVKGCTGTLQITVHSQTQQ